MAMKDPMKPGTYVRMSAQLKDKMRVLSGAHIREFGRCVGIVEGPVDWNKSGEADPAKLGPAVDVRWQPSNLRYMYDPDDLEVVVRRRVPCRQAWMPNPRRHQRGGLRQLCRGYRSWAPETCPSGL